MRATPSRGWLHIAVGLLLLPAVFRLAAWPEPEPALLLLAKELEAERSEPGWSDSLDLLADLPEDAPATSAGPVGSARLEVAAPRGEIGLGLNLLRHVIEPGESLAMIAERFGLDVLTLFASNDLDDPDVLTVGRELTVPPVPGVVYRVSEGDDLNTIAERYGLAVRDVMHANGVQDSELIVAGQALLLPGARPRFTRLPTRQEAGGPTLEESEGAVLAVAAGEAGPAETLPGQTLLGFLWPAAGPITTYFRDVGWTSPRGHAGLDIAAPWGAAVAAAQSGRVLVATRAGGPYGIQVILDHGDGLRTVYGHLSQLDVEVGQRVARGQRVGLVGSTGFSTGPHLHFEVRQSGELRDPLGFLR